MDLAIEHFVFGRADQTKIALDRIVIDEEMRRLDQKQLRIGGEIAHGPGQKIA